MKFSDGYWQIRQGVIPHYPAQAFGVKVETDALVITAPTKKIRSRGDTLNLPVLTVRFSSPLPNVIRVQVTHHKGVKRAGPEFDLYPQSTQVQIHKDDQAAALTSGQLTVRVPLSGDWRVDFLDGERPVTSSGWRGMAYMETESGPYILDELALGVGETVYGLGERFTAFVKNGQMVDLWNEDGGTASEQAYKNIPFYMTNRGYGVFINHPEKVSLEVASEKVERVQFSVPGESLDYFVIYGPTPKEVLERYTALTGLPALPPAWTFGLWLTTSFTTSYDEATVTSMIEGMAQRDIPLHVFHFDCFWMKAFQWVDFTWDSDVFPDPESMLWRLKSKGLHVCVWINPYIGQESPMFDEGMQHGYLLKRPDGSVFQWDKWQAGMGLVDFTNPEACRWYADKLRALVDMGVDCFKTDFGERIPTGVVYYDGSDPLKMHNYYTFLYNQVVFEVLEEKLGKGEAAVFARSATAGSQQFPVHWGGDSTATFESMAESLRGGLSLGLSGFGFWSHDIGGFEQTASADVYKRWCAFGLLSSHSRLHGSSSYRVPWLFDEREQAAPGESAVEVLRYFTKLKCRLMPYLFGAAVQAHEHGTPVMRAMLLEFPDDPACDTLDRQYMLGDALLVAPVFTPDGRVDFYLPEGKWTDFFTGAVIDGGRWLHQKHSFLSLPLLVRPGTVLPVGVNETAVDYDYTQGLTWQVFEAPDGASLRGWAPGKTGGVAAEVAVTRRGQELTIETVGADLPDGWQVLLRGVESVQSAAGGRASRDPLGTRITPQAGARKITVKL